MQIACRRRNFQRLFMSWPILKLFFYIADSLLHFCATKKRKQTEQTFRVSRRVRINKSMKRASAAFR